jgi:polyhydroxyalkanoate synthesis regulator protein
MKTVIKYGNRKLYDKEQSRYISIRELLEKFPLGTFKVVKHGETAEITTEILLGALTIDGIENDTKVKVMQHCIAEMGPQDDLFN